MLLKITFHPSAKVLSEINATLVSLWYRSMHSFSLSRQELADTVAAAAAGVICMKKFVSVLLKRMQQNLQRRMSNASRPQKRRPLTWKNTRDYGVGRTHGYSFSAFLISPYIFLLKLTAAIVSKELHHRNQTTFGDTTLVIQLPPPNACTLESLIVSKSLQEWFISNYVSGNPEVQ